MPAPLVPQWTTPRTDSLECSRRDPSGLSEDRGLYKSEFPPPGGKAAGTLYTKVKGSLDPLSMCRKSDVVVQDSTRTRTNGHWFMSDAPSIPSGLIGDRDQPCSPLSRGVTHSFPSDYVTGSLDTVAHFVTLHLDLRGSEQDDSSVPAGR